MMANDKRQSTTSCDCANFNYIVFKLVSGKLDTQTDKLLYATISLK